MSRWRRLSYRRLSADPLYQNLMAAFGVLPAWFAYAPVSGGLQLVVAGAWVVLLGTTGWRSRRNGG
jgi:hypothetical protein